MTNASILAAFERMWQHVIAKVDEKANVNDVVDLTSSQTISGVKTFDDGIKLGGATMSYDTTEKAIVFNFE